MFSATLDDVSLLRDSLGAVSELIDEVELQVKPGGIKMVAADKAVVVVVDFFLSKDAFKEYDYSEDTRIGVNLASLLQILRRAGPADRLKIRIDGNKMSLVLEGESIRSFVLPLLDVTREETPPLDKLTFPATFSISSEIISSGVDDAELVGDSVVLTLRKDRFVMKSESDSSLAQLEIIPGNESLRVLDVNEPVRARYSVDYLKKIMKARKLAGNVTVSMATDYPVKFQFGVPGKMDLGFVLAPRIEE
jgi:proliferating cell nuclear antigen